MVNMTEICTMSPDKAELSFHFSHTVPFILISLIGFMLIFFIIGLLMLKEEKSKVKLAKIFFISVVLSSVILIFTIFFPMTINNLFGL